MANGQANAAVMEDESPTLNCGHDGPPILYSMMPMNSGKDFKAFIPEVAQPVMASGQSLGNQGGDVVLVGTLMSSGAGMERPAGMGSEADFCVPSKSGVRRLTPVECERLQGFPDNWTRIHWRGKQAEDCPDGPRYRAIGNSMAVPVIRWIGERIAMVDGI